MAYSRQNLLEKILEIQQITLEYTRKGVSQQWVYENVVRPRFYISMRTYNSYLSTNAKAQLRKSEAREKDQLSLF